MSVFLHTGIHKVCSVKDPCKGGEDGEADEDHDQHARLVDGAPGLGHHRVTHKDVALNCQC